MKIRPGIVVHRAPLLAYRMVSGSNRASNLVHQLKADATKYGVFRLRYTSNNLAFQRRGVRSTSTRTIIAESVAALEIVVTGLAVQSVD